MNLKIDPCSYNITQLTCQKGIKSLWQLVKEKGKRLKRSDVFRMYEEYCEDNGCQGHVKSGFFKKMEGKGFLVRKYNGDYCYQDIAIWEEDFQPLEAGEKTPFDEHSEQLKLNI